MYVAANDNIVVNDDYYLNCNDNIIFYVKADIWRVQLRK